MSPLDTQRPCQPMPTQPLRYPPHLCTAKVALAATAIGADGLIIEVHNDPPHAKCDGQQSLTPERFDNLMKKVNSLRAWRSEQAI